MPSKENTMQLPPQFPSTGTSESESETNKKLFKIGKYIIYNNNIYTDFMKACDYDSVFVFLSLKT